MTPAPALEFWRGFVYFARLDKLRPVLVVSPNLRNALATDVIVVPCSTRLSVAPTHVRLRKGEAGLAATSIAKCEQVTTLHKSDLRLRALGRSIGTERMREIERAILRAIGVPIPMD